MHALEVSPVLQGFVDGMNWRMLDGERSDAETGEQFGER
jgi:hypothetical protein